MDASDVKLMIQHLQEEAIEPQFIPFILDYMIPKTSYELLVYHKKFMQAKEDIYEWNEFKTRFSEGFLYKEMDTLQFIIRFHDFEKIVKHVFRVPHSKFTRDTWVNTFTETISAYETRIFDIPSLYIKLNTDSLGGTHSTFIFAASSLPNNDTYHVSIEYKMTAKWVSILQNMNQFFNLIRS